MTKKVKYAIQIQVVEVDGKKRLKLDNVEKDSDLQDISLVVYALRQAEMDLVDRYWKEGDGYEVTDFNDYEGEGEEEDE